MNETFQSMKKDVIQSKKKASMAMDMANTRVGKKVGLTLHSISTLHTVDYSFEIPSAGILPSADPAPCPNR